MKFWGFAIVFAALAVWFGSGMVESRNKAVEQGYQIAQLTRQIAALEEQIEKLKITRAQLLEPSRLKRTAKLNHLHETTSKNVVVMEAEYIQ